MDNLDNSCAPTLSEVYLKRMRRRAIRTLNLTSFVVCLGPIVFVAFEI